MQSLTVRAVAQGVGVIVLLLALYGLSTQNTAAISALQQRTEAQQRQIKDLRTEVDALTQAHERTLRLATAAHDALTSVRADLGSVDDRFSLLVRRVDQLSTTLGATSTNIDRMGDRVLQAEDTLRLVRVEFADVKRDADASQTSMSEAADKMHTRVNSIEEDVHSWDKSVESMRADVDRLESAFKRVQFELLNSDSRGIASPFAGLGAGAGAGAGAGGLAEPEDDFRPRPFSRSQPQIRSAEADAALSARRHQLPREGVAQTAQDDPDAAAKRAALAAHGLKVIQEERERREREDKQKAQGIGPRPIHDIHLEPQRDDRSLAQKYI